MSTNKPSNDQPDKASDFDDELGVPAYKPTNDSTPASASPASASPASANPDAAGAKSPPSSRDSAAPKSSAAASTAAGAAGGAASGAAAKARTSPSDEPTTSFQRPKDADIKASTANKAGSQRAGGARIVESVDPVAAQPSSAAPKAQQEQQAPAAASAQSAATQAKPSQSAAEQAAPKRTAAEQPAQAEAVEESQRSSVFDRPGRAQPQEITPNNTQAPQSPVESQPRETMNMGPTTGSQNNPYDDRDFASRNVSFEEEPTTVTPAADYGYEPTTVQPAASPAGDATSYGAAGAAGAGAAGAGAAGMASTQHFDSPSQYSDETAMSLDADSAAAAQYEEEKALRRQYGKRGTIDFGLLFIRIALGGYLIIEGVRTLFSIGASTGISGLEGEYANYAMSNLLATGMPVLQLVAGVFLVLGLLTPLASMAAMVATGFMAIHELAASGTGLDIFAWPEALWLALVLFVVNVGVQFTGPGFISVDSALGVKALSSPARRPLASSWIFFILGAAALVAVWWFGAGINPLN